MNRNIRAGFGNKFTPSTNAMRPPVPLQPHPQQLSRPAAFPTTTGPRGPTLRRANDVFNDDDDSEEELAVVKPPTLDNSASNLASTPASGSIFDDDDDENDSNDNKSSGASPTTLTQSQSNTPTSVPTRPLMSGNIAINIKKPLIKISKTLGVTSATNPTPSSDLAHDNQLVQLATTSPASSNTDALHATNQPQLSPDPAAAPSLEYQEVTEEERIAYLKEQKRLKKQLYKQIQQDKDRIAAERGNIVSPEQTLEERFRFPKDWPRDGFTFYIGNLGSEVTKDTLIDYFKGKYPSVLTARIIYERDGKTSKGYGHICFSNALEMAKAFSKENKQFVGSRRCVIQKADLQDAKTNGIRYDAYEQKKMRR